MEQHRDAPLRTSDLAAPRPTTVPPAGPPAHAGGHAEGPQGQAASPDAGDEPLLASADLDSLRRGWEEAQASFVDEPRAAVARADELVADVMQRLADTFARERSSLEGQWDRGDEVSTEDLRIALQRYRSFFNRLLRA